MIKYFLLFAWGIDLIVLTSVSIILFCDLELLRSEIRRLREVLEGTK